MKATIRPEQKKAVYGSNIARNSDNILKGVVPSLCQYRYHLPGTITCRMNNTKQLTIFPDGFSAL